MKTWNIHMHAAVLLILVALPWCVRATTEVGERLAPYNIVWDSQSKGSVDSMPVSGHNLGLNVWVENGDILFLIGSPNCMDENGMQVKLGLIRVGFDGPVFDKKFRQELRLVQSEIVIDGKKADGSAVKVTLWCEAQQPVVHVTLASEKPVGLTVSYETWNRYVASFQSGGIQWSYRLPEVNPRRLRDMRLQRMEEFAKAVPDPLSKLTLGGRIDGKGLVAAGISTNLFNGMKTQVCSVRTGVPVKGLDLTLTLRMAQDDSIAAWEKALAAAAGRATQDIAGARADALAWWASFWDRSHIVISDFRFKISDLKKEKPEAVNLKSSISNQQSLQAWQAGRNYQLIRYMLAANTSGRAMTLFNGGIFPCTGNPDQRNWDGCQFMAQNQRLVYWPMLRAGDFDMLKVACDFYRDRTEMSRLHARKFWGVDGVIWPEPFSIFGLDAIGVTADGRSSPSHLNYHYTSGMEFALMMLEYGCYGGQQQPGYLEAADGIISYYDQFYQKALKTRTGKPLDDNGRLVIYPSDALEIYHGCTNNTDVIAGLTALTRGLLALPPDSLSAGKRAFYEEFQKRLPDFTMAVKDGREFYAPARSWQWVFHNGNMEFPQMYVCFPFGILSLGRSNMKLAMNTWDLGAAGNPAVQKQNQCWYQSAINFARMGETMQAAKLTTGKLLHPGARFPVFYRTHYAGGAGEFCHLPDTDHGGCSMIALQEMLMQADGRRILLGPAWPAEWACNFKLHAPYQTTVEGHVADGNLVVDKVTPESRRKDVELFPLKSGQAPVALSQGKPARASSMWSEPGYDAAKAFDGDSESRWGGAGGARSGWLEVDLETPAKVSRAVIEEIAWPSTVEFAIEALQPDDVWKTIASGTTIGSRKEVNFSAVTARKFRLHLLKTTNNPNIEEFQLFE